MTQNSVKRKHTIYSVLEKRSFRGILIFSFIFVSIVPILTLQYFSYNRLSKNLQNNMTQLSMTNVSQTNNNLKITLDAYNDLLYQIYTNDEIIALINSIDTDDGQTNSLDQLRRMLRGMCYAKNGIESISIITSSGNAIYFDKLTASYVNSSWMGKENLSIEAILKAGMKDYATSMFPTRYVTSLGTKPYYLFHMIHRIIDYKNVEKDMGVVVLSLNEDILQDICNQDVQGASFNFIVDEAGHLISYPNKARINTLLRQSYNPGDKQLSEEAYKDLLAEDGYLSGSTAIYFSSDSEGWRVVSVVDQSFFYDEIASQQRNILIVGIIILGVAALFILAITTLLSRSMDKVTAAMKQAEKGDLSVTVSEENIFSSEMMTIVKTFNKMMHRIFMLLEEVKSATMRQKDAEIKVLEAQINPHFLYNILDSINWMAIDKDQYEVSHMITSLAKILRYSINNSNAIVPLREEIEWLRQYLYLQHMRCKNGFDYTIDVNEQLLDYPTHKLILQPFVENSIVHGFKDSDRKNLLSIAAKDCGETLQIRIHDNGCGIESDMLANLNAQTSGSGDHIGMANAIGRIRMYYGDNAAVIVDSEPGVGTTVTIRLVKNIGGDI